MPSAAAVLSARDYAGAPLMPEYILSAQAGKPAIHTYAWGKEQPLVRSAMPEPITAIAVSPQGTFVVAGGVSGQAYLWCARSGDMLAQWRAHYKPVTAVQWTGCGGHAVTGGEDGLVHAWALPMLADRTLRPAGPSGEVTNPEPVHTWPQHSGAVTALLCIGAASAHAPIISVGLDRTVLVLDVPTGAVLARMAAPAPITCACVDPLWQAVYLGSADGTVFAHSLAASHASASMDSYAGHSGAVMACAVSSDGTRLYSTGVDGCVKVWDTTTRAIVATWTPPVSGGSLLSGAEGAASQADVVSLALIMPRPADLRKLRPEVVRAPAPFLRKFPARGEAEQIAATLVPARVPRCGDVLGAMTTSLQYAQQEAQAVFAVLQDAGADADAALQELLPEPEPDMELSDVEAATDKFTVPAMAADAAGAAGADETAGAAEDEASMKERKALRKSAAAAAKAETARAAELAKLRAEVTMLKEENARWQAVNNQLLQKWQEATAAQ